MTDTMTSQNIDISSYVTLYVFIPYFPSTYNCTGFVFIFT